MTAVPLVSIILPTRDRAALLPRAVASVLAQTERDWELILVDNNRGEPPLAGQAAVQTWLADPRVRLLQANAANAAAVRNCGLGNARGEWITYLDDDDAYRPEKLARQLALARRTGAGLVLCGATFHLRGRDRVVQGGVTEWRGDDVLMHARWNTPLLLHRHPGERRFDETLSSGEDAEFAHRLLAWDSALVVPVEPMPLVDIYPQTGSRVNTNPAPLRATAARILALRRNFFSRPARRRYLLQNLLAVAKLTGRPGRCVALSGRLLCESHGADWRPCANALAVSLGVFPGRWVS